MSKSLNHRRARHRRRPTPHDPVERVEALTRTARGTWLGLLSYLAFVGVTLMGVEDADFFLTERQTALPLIGVSVPTNLFFYIAPTLGAMLYIHMHLYLLKLWKALAEVPSNPTRPTGESIAPWIVSDMALAQRDGASHAYPLRSLAAWVAILSIFAAGPLVLAAFWWRSMPKHDEVLTILACGVPLFVSVLAGWESMRSLDRGGTEERHMPWREGVGWGAGFGILCILGFIETGTVITDRLLKPAHLQGVAFVKTPTGWLPYDEAERVFRREWCADQGMPPLACGPGPLARDDEGDKVRPAGFLRQQRAHWCRTLIDDAAPEEHCTAIFTELDALYQNDWRTARENALDALPKRDMSGVDLRGANLDGARMEGANLSRARMEGADIHKARMEGADLRWARMEGARLSGARMEGADVVWASMEGTTLLAARMEGADFRKARMEGTDLRYARMAGTNLTDAQMDRANLRWARMDSRTSLRGATLRGAAIRDVDYSSVDISTDQVKSAFGDASVILPEGIDRPDHWPDWDLPSSGDHAFDTEWRKWQADPDTYTPPPEPEG